MIISLDGPAGSGKSTIAGLLAQKLGFVHFNSGKLYRGVACYFVFNKLNLKNIETATDVPTINLKTEFKANVQHVYVNGIDYTAHLHDNIISVNSAKISQNPYIRSVIDVCQREYGNSHNIVIDGRDIGSYVFPNADYKFYLECDVKERANRRYKQLKGSVDYNQILKEIEERDNIDKNKKYAPLVVPKGAIIIDSTNLNIEQTVNEIYKHIKL